MGTLVAWLTTLLPLIPRSPTFWTGVARLGGCAIFVAAMAVGEPSILAKILGVILLVDAAGHAIEYMRGGQ